jgi:branched-chain amino acid transport system permease protein
VIGALLIYSLQQQLSSSGHDEWAQVVLGAILIVVVLFAPEGLYARIVARPRQAVVAGIALVAGIVVSYLLGWGDATDWLGTGLAAATAVLLVGGGGGLRRRRRTPGPGAPAPAGEPAAR